MATRTHAPEEQAHRAPAAPEEPPGRRPAVGRRALLLGVLLIPLNAWWLAQVEYVRYSDTPTIPSLYFHCVSLLLLLVGLNALVGRRRQAWALRPEELLVVYAMLVIASNLAGHDQLQILFTTVAWPLFRATPENRWGETILPHLPRQLLPDARALPPLFAGHSSLYVEGHWRAWLGPLAVWLLVVCALAFTMFCMMSLVRRQWDHERLTYPLAEVPLAVVQTEGGIFGRPLFWIAFALAAGLQILSLASTFFPTLPVTNLGVRYFPLFQTWPWRAFGTLPVCFYPFALGVSFLLPLEVSLSCWFFSLVGRLEMVAGAAAGYTNANDFPFVHQQVAGAFIGFALCVLWGARRHLAAAWQRARGAGGPDDSGEPLSYRAALFGFLGGMLILFAGGVAVGVRPWIAAAYLVAIFLIVLTFARIRAEAGLPSFGLERYGPDQVLAQYTSLTGRELGMVSLLFFLTRTHRQLPMQNYADGMRLADRSHTDQRRFGLALLLATVLGAAFAFWAMLHVSYQTGLTSARFTGPAGWAFGDAPWNRMHGWATTAPVPRPGEGWGYGAGIGMTFLLAGLRARYLWWPLHPVGYVVSTSIALQRLWLPIFAAWLLKLLILRYGGLKSYRGALPFFLGLVLGQFAAGFLRTLLDLALGLYLPANSGIGGL